MDAGAFVEWCKQHKADVTGREDLPRDWRDVSARAWQHAADVAQFVGMGNRAFDCAAIAFYAESGYGVGLSAR